MYEATYAATVAGDVTKSTIIFVLGLLLLLAAYVSLTTALQRMFLKRVFTFQLFTLIPFEVLERLAIESHEKSVRVLVVEPSREEEAGPSHDGPMQPQNKAPPTTVSRISDEDRRPSSKSDRVPKHPLPTQQDTMLKSCLKQPSGPRREIQKHVKINPKTQIFWRR